MRTQHTLCAALVVALQLAAVPQLPAPIYILMPSIAGEVSESGHMDWINVLSVNMPIQRPSASLPPVLGDLVAVKTIDRSSPLLAQALCDGQSFPDVTVDLTRILTPPGSASREETYLQIKLQNAQITSYSINGSGLDDGSIPTETLSLNFDRIDWTYTRFDAAGDSVEVVRGACPAPVPVGAALE